MIEVIKLSNSGREGITERLDTRFHCQSCFAGKIIKLLINKNSIEMLSICVQQLFVVHINVTDILLKAYCKPLFVRTYILLNMFLLIILKVSSIQLLYLFMIYDNILQIITIFIFIYFLYYIISYKQ